MTDGAWGVTVAGDYAYVASRSTNTLSIIDISNPASPAQVGTIGTADLEGARNVAVARGYAYVTSVDAVSLMVIDLPGTYKAAEYFDCTDDNLDTWCSIKAESNTTPISDRRISVPA